MDDSPTSAATIIELLADRKLLGEVGLTDGHARTIKARGRIPAHWDQPIVKVAEQHQLPITYELLASLRVRAAKPERVPS